MARTLATWLILAAAAAPALGGTLKWEPQLREMGYLFLHLSNINVINGLNLTREQAVKLRALARQVESAAVRPPSRQTILAPELEEVRKTWLEARDLILAGKSVPPELEERANRSRAAESAVLRQTIRPKPIALDTRCVSCHMAPDTTAGPPMTVTPAIKRLMDRAHAEALYGTRGLVAMAVASPQVEALLTDGQKAILGGFSCCLVPPQDLSNPTRAGQAEGSAKALDLMRKIRQCPEGMWPFMRSGILKAVDRITVAVSPGATAARKDRTRGDVEKLLDRVRTLGDVEFEIEKNDLAAAVKTAIVPAQGDAPFKTAFFLLVPGSSQVYTQYLTRLATAERAEAVAP